MTVCFQYKADIRVESSERLLSSVSGHSAKSIELVFSVNSERCYLVAVCPKLPCGVYLLLLLFLVC